MRNHTAITLAVAPFVALALAWTTPAAALTKQEIAMLPDAGRQAILEQGARAEGALVWYSTMPTDSASRPITDLFMKKYPFLKAEFISAASEEILQRSQAEFRARSVRVDIMTASVADSLGKTGLIQKFRSPETASLPAQYVDPEGFWVSIRTIWTGVGWNTKQISAADAPKTWEDLANPKYKGKMFWSGGSTGAPRTITHFRSMWGEDRTVEFLNKLKANDIRTAAGNAAAITQLMMAGEYPMVLAFPVQQISKSRLDGTPVDGLNPDPATAFTSAAAVMFDAPHPHAAMLFMDFLLSKDGQQMIANAGYNPSRTDVEPLAENRYWQPNLNGKKEILLRPEEEEALRPKSLELYQTMFR